MTWRYIPAVRKVDGEEEWSIRELYEADGKVGWTGPIEPVGESRDGLAAELLRMLAAVEDGADYLHLDAERVKRWDAS